MLAAREAIVTVDARQRIVAMNPAAQRMFRCEDAPLVGQALSVLIPQTLRAAHADHVRQFAESGAVEKGCRNGLTVQGLRSRR
jgi:PAS domain-containing protein